MQCDDRSCGNEVLVGVFTKMLRKVRKEYGGKEGRWRPIEEGFVEVAGGVDVAILLTSSASIGLTPQRKGGLQRFSVNLSSKVALLEQIIHPRKFPHPKSHPAPASRTM